MTEQTIKTPYDEDVIRESAMNPDKVRVATVIGLQQGYLHALSDLGITNVQQYRQAVERLIEAAEEALGALNYHSGIETGEALDLRDAIATVRQTTGGQA